MNVFRIDCKCASTKIYGNLQKFCESIEKDDDGRKEGEVIF
ncbi:hypothetical protein B23_1901 [Geobacillus thermoleovorans B23]|nr:hypothetical protein B23_1901 [Geobacillus thermoleovorans B23]